MLSFLYVSLWQIQWADRDARPTLSPISFIFMQFLAKILPNNSFTSQSQGLVPLSPHLGNAESATTCVCGGISIPRTGNRWEAGTWKQRTAFRDLKPTRSFITCMPVCVFSRLRTCIFTFLPVMILKIIVECYTCFTDHFIAFLSYCFKRHVTEIHGETKWFQQTPATFSFMLVYFNHWQARLALFYFFLIGVINLVKESPIQRIKRPFRAT